MTTTREQNLAVTAMVKAAMQTTHVMIPSRESGPGHRVTLFGGEAVACTCRGWHFNGRCWAVNAVREVAAVAGS